MGITFGILIALILLLIAVSVYEYRTLKSDIRTAANEVLQIMKVENGADSSTRRKFDDLLIAAGLDPSKVNFVATPKSVQRGDFLQVVATREYNIFALKSVGVDHSITMRVQVSGYAHKYIREGD
ncbi:DUF4320 family protein [Paenibacillus woosongensis]|nr:DUF4320 family protein [Paenibacillus woosongensis]